jgi:hypothetical protein
MANTALLKSAFGEVVRHPERWRLHGDWRPAFARHVLAAAGGPEVTGMAAWGQAARLLDVTADQERALFAFDNTLDDLRRIAHDLCEVA